MSKREDFRGSQADLLGAADGGTPPLGVYQPGVYQDEAKAFFRQCVGEETYVRAMSSEVGQRHHYVAARAFLNQKDWERFVWIEQHGSLTGYPG